MRMPKGDHPRRCGENGRTVGEKSLNTGSPPQVRGKPLSVCGQTPLLRITPAGAGKTKFPALLQFLPQDHPRRCGENPSAICPFSPGSGSPPQVRGKPALRTFSSAAIGITPAGAGKTPAIYTDMRRKQDHPRRCGENMKKGAKFNPLRGSPPQVRGKLEPYGGLTALERITPAGAGKTHFSC